MSRDGDDVGSFSMPADDDARSAPRSRQLTSAALFQGRREIVIVHHGQEYRLRITRADKLILTK
jgi:hemin uptake protein HemP